MQQNNSQKWTGQLYRKGKRILPHLARLLLVSPFLENGFRMCYESADQQDYINHTWNCGSELAFLYVLINMLGQPIGALMTLARYRVKVACSLLSFILLLQTLAESLSVNTAYLTRAAALAGSLLLLFVDGVSKDRNPYAGRLSGLTKGQVSYTQLSGPLMVLLMIAALPGSTSPVLVALRNLIATLLWMFTPCDKRIKFGSLAFTLIGFAILLWSPRPWKVHSEDFEIDFSRYDLLPTLCVTGGLLMIISLGFGDAGFHERRKILTKSFTGSQTDLRSHISDGSDIRTSAAKSQNCTRRRSF